jgi:hypothetical protein
MLDHSCQVQRHSYAERGHDFYETPSVAVEALLRVETLPHRIWEPACGRGAIVNVLRAHGHEVVATDLVDYGIPITAPGYWGVDFLAERRAPEGTQAIVTNPPFKLAEEFVEHALTLCPRVVMLLRLAFLESDRRSGILEGRGFARIHVFRKRLPMMHRAEWQGPKANSGMAFCWMVWDREHRGPPTVHRVSWERRTQPEQEIPVPRPHSNSICLLRRCRRVAAALARARPWSRLLLLAASSAASRAAASRRCVPQRLNRCWIAKNATTRRMVSSSGRKRWRPLARLYLNPKRS